MGRCFVDDYDVKLAHCAVIHRKPPCYRFDRARDKAIAYVAQVLFLLRVASDAQSGNEGDGNARQPSPLYGRAANVLENLGHLTRRQW